MNLVEDPWIPVVARSGAVELGLREVFAQADDIAAIASGDAIVDAALLRLLFAVDAAAAGDPLGWLDDQRHRFELFDPVAPFWQNPNLAEFWDLPAAASPPGTLARPNFSPETIVHSVDSAMSSVAPRPLTPAQAARYLVMRQQFSTGGIQSFPLSKAYPLEFAAKTVNKSAPKALALICPLVFVEEATLAATVAANRWSAAPLGAFHFTWPGQALPSKVVLAGGLVDAFTWPSRSMLLGQDRDGMVDKYMCCDGLRPEGITEEMLPHTTYVQPKPDEPWEPRQVSFRRPGWRQLLDAYVAAGPGLLSNLPATTTGHLRIIGLSTYTSRIDGIVDDTLPLPTIAPQEAAVLADAVTDANRTLARAGKTAESALGLGSWASRNVDMTTSSPARNAQTLVADAFTGARTVADAAAAIAALGYRSAHALVDDLAVTYPAVAGQVTARLHRQAADSSKGTR